MDILTLDTLGLTLIVLGIVIAPFIILVCVFAIEYFYKSNYLLTAAIRKSKAVVPVIRETQKKETAVQAVPSEKNPDTFDIAEARRKLGLEPETGDNGAVALSVANSATGKGAVTASKTGGQDKLPSEPSAPLKERRKHRKKVQVKKPTVTTEVEPGK